MERLSKRLLRAGLALGLMLGLAGSASALPIDWYVSPGNTGATPGSEPVSIGLGSTSLDIWVNASAAASGPGVLAFEAPTGFTAVGPLTFTSWTVDPGLSAAAGGFTQGANTATSVLFSVGAGTVTFATGPLRIGTLVVNASGVGGGVSVSGTYFSLGFAGGWTQATGCSSPRFRSPERCCSWVLA